MDSIQYLMLSLVVVVGLYDSYYDEWGLADVQSASSLKAALWLSVVGAFFMIKQDVAVPLLVIGGIIWLAVRLAAQPVRASADVDAEL